MAILELAAVFGSLWYLDREKQRTLASGSVGRPPLWTPDAVSAIATIGPGGIRTIRENVRETMLQFFDRFSLRAEEVVGGAPGELFKVVPYENGAASARQIVEGAPKAGVYVMVSLTCALIGSDEDKYVFLTRPENRSIAGMMGHFALLFDEPLKAVRAPAKAEAGPFKASEDTEPPEEEKTPITEPDIPPVIAPPTETPTPDPEPSKEPAAAVPAMTNGASTQVVVVPGDVLHDEVSA